MVSHPEHFIRLDTGAFRAARTARAARGIAYWIVLAVGAAGIAVAFAVAAEALSSSQPAHLASATRAVQIPGAPAPADTPVAIWNASRVDGAANRLKIRLAGLGYPAVAARSRNLPKGGLKGTWVFYTPGHAAAAAEVAQSLHVRARRSVRPLDGIRPETIAPAIVLVVVGR
jgi:hypothetical protein